jgi:hypothetical protein
LDRKNKKDGVIKKHLLLHLMLASENEIVADLTHQDPTWSLSLFMTNTIGFDQI